MPTTRQVHQPGLARPRLKALSGVRIFASVHIYLFHLKQAHDAGLLTFPILSRLPEPIANLLGRGYISTGFFFQLSGFLLAYAYLDAAGDLKTTRRRFWKGRLSRLYPVYLISLLLLIPAPALLPFTAKNPSGLEVLGGVATSLTLMQAWFPSFALWWNAPAWALSAFAAFYAIFPAFSRWIRRFDRGQLLRLAIGLSFLAWLPAALYWVFRPTGDPAAITAITLGDAWLMALRFNPLTWLPQFLSGLALGRWFALGVDQGAIAIEAGSRRSKLPTSGDLVAMILFAVIAFVPGIPYVALRHGLLAPLMLILLNDLAENRGILGRLLAWNGFARLSEASLYLFALQMPAGLWFCIAVFSSPSGNTAQLLGMIAWTLGISILATEFTRRLTRRGLQTRSSGSQVFEPSRISQTASVTPATASYDFAETHPA